MFWNDPTLYGATFPYKDINLPVQTPFLGSVLPWQKFVPPVYGMQLPYMTEHMNFPYKETPLQTPYITPNYPYFPQPFYGVQQPFNYPQIPFNYFQPQFPFVQPFMNLPLQTWHRPFI